MVPVMSLGLPPAPTIGGKILDFSSTDNFDVPKVEESRWIPQVFG